MGVHYAYIETNRNPLIQLLVVLGLYFLSVKDETNESNFFHGSVLINVPS